MKFIRKFFHKHNFSPIAYDSGFTTRMAGRNDMKHQIIFQKCRTCGERKITKVGSDENKHHAAVHPGLVMSKLTWIAQNVLVLTGESVVLDREFVMTQGQVNASQQWEHCSLREVGVLFRQLESLPEFQEMCGHQMVQDAWDELQTTIKLHDGIEAPK